MFAESCIGNKKKAYVAATRVYVVSTCARGWCWHTEPKRGRCVYPVRGSGCSPVLWNCCCDRRVEKSALALISDRVDVHFCVVVWLTLSPGADSFIFFPRFSRHSVCSHAKNRTIAVRLKGKKWSVKEEKKLHTSYSLFLLGSRCSRGTGGQIRTCRRNDGLYRKKGNNGVSYIASLLWAHQ